MYTKHECEKIVTDILVTLTTENELVISGSGEHSWGWVFYYNTKEYLEGNVDAALLGNAPYIVNKFTGEVAVTGTSGPISSFIEAYEKHLMVTEGFTLEEKEIHWAKFPKNASWF